MNPSDWTLRLIPRRSLAFFPALAVSAACLAFAIGIRIVTLGFVAGWGLSSTFFPAYIVATLLCGGRWGWGCWAVSMAFGMSADLLPGVPDPDNLVAFLFALSGAVTVFMASALRDTLMRLEQANRARNEAETALAGNAARLRLAEEAGGLGQWEWNFDNATATLSRSAAEETPQSIGGRNFVGYLAQVHADDRPRMQAAYRQAIMDGRFFDTEYRMTTKDGSPRWVHSRGEVIRDADGRAVRVVGYNFDITERRLSEDRLRESEARFRALADSAPVPMWVTRLDRTREFVNAAYVDLMGAPYDEAVTFDWRSLLHPEDIDRITAESIAGEASLQPFALEGRYRIGGGDYRWLRSISRPRLDLHGDLIGFIGIAVDISDAKRGEADLKRLNELLAERVQEALAERDQAQAALMQSQKLEAVGQLTGGVAHDFNNLLTVVIGALDIVARHPDDAPRRIRLLDAALSAARRGERLTQQLLAFARRQPLRTEVVQVDELIAQDEPLFRRAVGEAVRLEFALQAPALAARLDAGQFEAALLNLVVNARDATPDGGLITIATRQVELTEAMEEAQPGQYLEISITDSGMGMSEETQAKAFEPFFTTKAVGKGTGLGLSQVYGFVRQSGGGARIDSRPGEGTRIALLLPTTTAPAAKAEAPVRDLPTAGLCILLVEDDSDVGELIETMLAELGHHVRRASHVEQALTLLKTHDDIQLVLTDVIMPGGKSGVDLARSVARLKPGLPVILSSGYTGDNLAPAEAAPWPLLRKPYTLQALAAAIAEAAEGAPVAVE